MPIDLHVHKSAPTTSENLRGCLVIIWCCIFSHECHYMTTAQSLTACCAQSWQNCTFP